MVTEERLNTLLAHANPVTDVSKIDLIDVGAAAYLATLEQRSSEVTQLETKTEEQPDQQRPFIAWLAAATAIIVIGVALLIINQGPDEMTPITEPTPTTVADAVPTTVVEETPSTVVSIVDQWDAIPVWTGGTQPDAYRSDVFFEPFSFEVPGGWWPKGAELPHYIDMSTEIGTMQDPSTLGLTLIDWDAGDVESTVASIRNDPDVSFSDTAPVEIGGAPGVTFTANRSSGIADPYRFYDDPEPVQNCSRRPCGEGVLNLVGDVGLVFYVVDVDGSTVTIVITDRQGGSFTESAQAVIDSITWQDLP